MEITKLDAARRQIDAAVRLYFEDGDEIAVHTLVGAAHIVITDLGAAAKQDSILDRYVVSDKRKRGLRSDSRRSLLGSRSMSRTFSGSPMLKIFGEEPRP